MSDLIHSSADEWSFQLSDGNSPDGLVLKEVYHAGHRLARDIRIVGIRVNGVRHFKLGSADCPTIQGRRLLSRPNAPGVFGIYGPKYGFEARYATTETDASSRIEFTQQYLFTGYGKKPAHEPGAVLSATRIFPLLRFQTTDPGIETVRVDYRLALSLDGFASLMEALSRAVKGKRLPNPNQAGIFRDLPTLPLDVLPLGKVTEIALRTYFKSSEEFEKELRKELESEGKKPGEVLFQSAKKPLQYEIIGKGLVNGAPADETWDNVHWWDARAAGDLPSAPGAFHAAHLHWRWSDEAGNPKLATIAKIMKMQRRALNRPGRGDVTPSLDALGQAQFLGPLVDPAIADQTIQFAITEDGDGPLAAGKVETTQVFSSLFTSLRTEPKEIQEGKELVLWLSFEARRIPLHDGFQGTVFIHGMYFAHDLEIPTPSTFTQGTTANKPPEKQTWERGAS